MNEYRHVCFKDLENYFSRKNLFSELNEDEKRVIRNNLGVASLEDVNAKEGEVFEGTYLEIKELVDNSQLNLLCKYIITDFQTIYKSNTNEVWGLEKNPSEIYSLILTPISNSKFDKRVSIIKNGEALDWIINYDFTSIQLTEEISTKGTITYLKDQNNNSAYYDFKNIKTRVILKSSDVTGLSNTGEYDLYTFSKIVNGQIKENSDDVSIMNNIFDYDCWGNVFLGETNNNHFLGGFKNNIFTKQCTYNKFEWNTTDNKFTSNIKYTKGSLKNALVNTDSYDNSITKEFRMLHSLNSSEPVFVVTYLDGDTLTNQVIKLNKL